MIVDTHVHVIARDEARYPLTPSGIGSDWYRAATCSAEELEVLMAAAGVDAAVLVQAFGAYSYDNAYVVAAAEHSGTRFVSVAVVNAEDPSAPAQIRELARRDGFGGIRLFSIGPVGRPQPAWLDDPATFPVWETCAELDLVVSVACLPEHLPRLARALDRFPEQSVVLDHCAFVDPAAPEDLLRLARHGNLHAKVTSHVLEAGERDGDPARVVSRLVAEFGADRLTWGSDFPQTRDRPYGELVALARRGCACLTSADRDALLGATATRLWPAFGLQDR